MIITTTPNVEGKQIKDYKSVVSGDAVLGLPAAAEIPEPGKDIAGGGNHPFERKLGKARWVAMEAMEQRAVAMGCNGVIGVRVDLVSVGAAMIVTVSGTAVTLS